MDYLEIWSPGGHQILTLSDDRALIGKARGNEVAISSDSMLSRTHAVFERYATGWSIRDMGSRNGTMVNGERIWGERHLKTGDEILVGKTRIIYRTEDLNAGLTMTEAAEAAPELTRRERDVLRALCRPFGTGDVFTEPASIRDIAKELVVTEAAVKQHLVNLYDKFAVFDQGERRRVRLANEAIRRGAVNVADLRDPEPTGERGHRRSR